MTSDLGDLSQKDDPYDEIGRPSKNDVKFHLFGSLVSYQLKRVGFQVAGYSEVTPSLAGPGRRAISFYLIIFKHSSVSVQFIYLFSHN